MEKIYRNSLIALLAVCIVVVGFLGSIRNVIYDQEFYPQEYDKLGLQLEGGKETYQLLQRYFESGSRVEPDIAVFTPNERSHLLDVTLLIQQMEWWIVVFIILGFLATFIFIGEVDSFMRNMSYSFLFGGIALLFLVGIVTLFAEQFVQFFDQFHMVFFSGNWQFPASSYLIQMVPLGFFYDATVSILKNAGIVGLVSVIASSCYLLTTKE